MKQELLREKKHEREKRLSAMADLNVVMALLILLLGLVFLMDIARYQWMMMVMLLLGFFMNLNMLLWGFMRRKTILCAVTAPAALALLGFFVYFSLNRI